MIKATLYPKTTRVSTKAKGIVLTEKLDGSNIGFFVKDNELHIAQRNSIFTMSEALDTSSPTSQGCYKGLLNWLNTYGQSLKDTIYEGTVIFGEWIGMGQLKYTFEDKFFMFAKGRFDDFGNVIKLTYDLSLLHYAFNNQEIPDFIKRVPKVIELGSYPTVEQLDVIYEEYTKEVGRNVEGFVINQNENIRKYVRMKNGKLSPHTEKGEER